MISHQKFEEILTQFDIKLNEYRVEIDDTLLYSETCINFCLRSIDQIKQIIVKESFANEKDEIYFFKEIKPRFYSKLIYFNRVYNIETHRPNGSIKIKRKYFQRELSKLKNYFDENLDFYRYYRTGSTYLDHKYFVRGQNDIRLQLDSHVYESDPNFSTSHDFKISTILANDLLQVHLEDELTKLDYKTNRKNTDFPLKKGITWTGSKVSLIELMYALHQTGSFNNGQADIKEIATYFENAFDVELGNYYRTYLELKLRHNPTKFIDSLKDALSRRIEDDDAK